MSPSTSGPRPLEKRSLTNGNLRTLQMHTVLPEIFARVLFSLNFTVGVGLHKLSARNFFAHENLDRVEFIAT